MNYRVRRLSDLKKKQFAALAEAVRKPPISEEERAAFNDWIMERVAVSQAAYDAWCADGQPPYHQPFFRLAREGESQMPIELGRPIVIFYANLLRHGVTLSVRDDKLIVGGNIDNLSPAYREEIVRRSSLLKELFTPEPPERLRPFFYRLINIHELMAALGVAAQIGIELKQTPVDGGWILQMGGSLTPKQPSKSRQVERVPVRQGAPKASEDAE